MPQPAENQLDRQNAIRRILADGPAETQQSLVEALTALGIEATQSCVSRDLREIGAVKTIRGYELATTPDNNPAALTRIIQLILGVEAAGPNLLVIRTAVGAAQQVALALDQSGWEEIVGNIGGDDTVFCAVRNVTAGRTVIRNIERLVARA